jgi:putative glutamine amidotransferase
VSKNVVIGITDCEKYPNYEKWMRNEPGVEVIRLGYRLSNLKEIKKCDGIILTGGEDVHPKFYDKPEYIEWCGDDLDELRDEFELSAIEQIQKNQLPLLGICRGLQITNVFFGGTLVPDLPTFGKFNHAKFKEGKDKYHPILIDQNSFLCDVVHAKEGEINSSHHQSADRIGKELAASSISPDGVVESIERKKPKDHPFLLLVQWHPERMLDQKSPLVKNLKRSFLKHCSK